MRKFLLFCVMLPFGVNAQIITTFAGTGVQGYSGDNGPATQAQFNSATAVVKDKNGNLFIADIENNVVRKVDVHGIITTFAGDTSSTLSGDGGPAAAAGLPMPAAITIDDIGNLYVSEPSSHIVRKIDTAGIISTFAGNDTLGFSGDGGPAIAASLSIPYGIAIDTAGNMYIADAQNSRIRKVSKDGTISTIAGNGSFYYNGENIPAINAVLDYPYAIAVDKPGNVYFSELGNNIVRKIDVAGIISTVAGTAGDIVPGYSGDGGPATQAKFDSPADLCLDTVGNLYISDMFNNRIRKVNKAGIVETVAGNGGTGGYWGDGYAAIDASLNQPNGLAVDQSGNLYIADVGNYVVRIVNNNTTAVPDVLSSNNDLLIYPNPAAAKDIMIKSSASQEKVQLRILDMSGRLVLVEELQFENGAAKLHTDLAPSIYSAQFVHKKDNCVQTQKLVIAQ